MHAIAMTPIGFVRSTRTTATDDDWEREQASVELDLEVVSKDALRGLDAFSHVEIVFHMDRVASDKIETAARHPRGNAAWPEVGILAQRAKNRPNQIGVTVCRVVGIDGARLLVEGLDAVDGSPVLDIKPWVRELGPRGDVFQPAWMGELMKDYWKVTCS